MTTSSLRTGGRILIDALRIHGADTVFCVPGESYLDALDALHDTPSIRVVVAKHEGAAANMAEADGKLTGRPGICFVTRGPGATHACVGVHTAMQDSTPMILFIGQIDRPFRDREAFQEVDYRAMFGPLAKWAAEIDDTSRIPEYVARAYQVATSGRPGPVVLSLPSDMLDARVDVPDVQAFRPAASAPAESDMAELARMLAAAQRPVVLLGGSGWTPAACADIAAFAQRHALPVATGFRRQHLFDNDDPHYAGHVALGLNPALSELVAQSDLLLVLGSRMSEITSQGYTLIAPPRPAQPLVHVYPDADELGRVYQADLGIVASMPRIAAALAALPAPASPPAGRRERVERARRDFEAFTTPAAPAADYQGVDLAQVVAWLSDHLPHDAFVTNGAGNYAVWLHRYYRYRRHLSQLAPTSGAMGYGLPAAIAAKLRYPERPAVCFAGDGCFLMYPQEIATAMQFNAPVITLVCNNGMYGTIRMHQERSYPGRVSATDIVNPDFAALARSFGAYGECVERTEDFAAAFERAQASGLPAVLELRTDPRQISPAMRLTK